MPKPLRWLVVALAVAAAAYLFWPRPTADATLYCSVDEDQFKVIVEDFTKETGVKVTSLGEPESSRSLGLVAKLDSEREHPVADVFWGNEIMNTVVLRDRGVLAPLPPGLAEQFPPAWRASKGGFVAFAARARVLLVNKHLLPDKRDWPSSVDDLLDPKWGGAGRGVAVALPLTGTTFTHAVAMFVRDPAACRAFWKGVADRGAKGELKLVAGNGAVMQKVKDEKNGIAWGLTDTDDSREAINDGAPVEIVYPDQAEGKPGACVIPNTVALVRGGPNPEAGKRLLAWLVSKANEERLAKGPSASMPLRDDVPAPDYVRRPGKDLRAMEVDWDRVGAERDRVQSFLQPMFER